uniref:Uncharacterized protein n=1 Tax=Candidatus Kentrum sp. LPFa TaxID=2126335 RepID=A0A450XYT9_9GAMM|nr:MAG: hypothetical protein BECKLPF1236A_GA0070988_102763 [Candidatus Kentron sp. LPFa]VFK34459.1 MAG: hypothetical protein BECKLPF1236C_GA0070990_102724 [Candidatus Kentron sp. LPFa]
MKKVLYILLIALAIVTVAIMPMMKGWLYTDIERIDRDFEGIFGGDASDKRAVASGGSSTMEKTIHLLVVHGIGRHCIGYADGLITGIARGARTYPPPLARSPSICRRNSVGKTSPTTISRSNRPRIANLSKSKTFPTAIASA